MFMVLSSWLSHCESSPGSFDECRTAPSGPRPSDQARRLRLRVRLYRLPESTPTIATKKNNLRSATTQDERTRYLIKISRRYSRQLNDTHSLQVRVRKTTKLQDDTQANATDVANSCLRTSNIDRADCRWQAS